MTLDESIQGMRLHVMKRAEASGSPRPVAKPASRARCSIAGGAAATLWRRRRASAPAAGPSRPSAALPPHIERRLLAVAIAEATWGAARLAVYAQRLWRLRLAPSTVQRLLRRHGSARGRQRLPVLEHHSAPRAGLLTQRTRQALGGCATAAPATSRPRAGEFVCWNLSSANSKAWGGSGITACDAASSFGVARILPALSPAAAAFLRDVLLPPVRRAGWTLQRVLTDRGNEFKASFDETCRARDPPDPDRARHAWTNGFVERWQQTILSEHWRARFRRHYFTSRATLDRSLRGFLQFYNFERPIMATVPRAHPATLFHGAVAAAR